MFYLKCISKNADDRQKNLDHTSKMWDKECQQLSENSVNCTVQEASALGAESQRFIVDRDHSLAVASIFFERYELTWRVHSTGSRVRFHVWIHVRDLTSEVHLVSRLGASL